MVSLEESLAIPFVNLLCEAAMKEVLGEMQN